MMTCLNQRLVVNLINAVMKTSTAMPSNFVFQSRDGCSYASKKNVSKMLEQYKSPVKQQVDLKVKLTPEEKMHFREAQESDPKFLNANRKLEESLLKCNGSKFRFNIPRNSKISGMDTSVVVNESANHKDTEIDTSVVNLNSSHDLFDDMVAAKKTNRSDANLDNEKITKSTNDSSRLSTTVLDTSFDEQIKATTLNHSTKSSSLLGSNHSVTSTIETRSTNNIESVESSKPSIRVKSNSKFVYRKATSTKTIINKTETNDIDAERTRPSSTITKPLSNDSNDKSDVDNILRELSFDNHLLLGANRTRPSSTITKPLKNDDNDKFDVDTVLRELSFENHLPLGANRTRPNSPLKNTHEPTKKKPSNPSTVQRKGREKDDTATSNAQSNCNTSLSNNISSFVSASECFNSTTTFDTADMTCTESRSKTGFENLPNVLNRISNSSAVKTTSNVSLLRLIRI